MKSGSGERESVVEDDWSEGREDELEERDVGGGERCTSLSEGGEDEQEELVVAGGEWLVSALVVASRGHRRGEIVASMRGMGKNFGADGGGGRQGERGEGERGERLEELGVSGGERLEERRR